MAVDRLFNLAKKHKGVKFQMSFYEIYGGRVYDLLNKGKRVQILEDGNNNVQIQGILEREARNPQEMHEIIEYGHEARTTHATVANNTSSRSHAICQIYITKGSKFMGKLILCDLAGSERAQDTQSNSRQRRLEGAEINKSLLALKECIRAMNSKQTHIPFRASKLTLALRDSFKAENIRSKIVMIACVCPGSSSSDHTINTLRYADRLKMKPKGAPASKAGSRANLKNKAGSQTQGRGSGRRGQDVSKGLEPSPQRRPHHATAGGGGTRNSRSKNPFKSPPSYPDSDALSSKRREQERGQAGRGSKNRGGRGGDHRRSGSKNQSSKRSSSKRVGHGQNRDGGSGHRNGAGKTGGRGDNAPKIPRAPNGNRNSDDDERRRKKRSAYKRDFDFMKSTLKVEKKNEGVDDDVVFDYQEKVDDMIEAHEEVLAMHMNILKVKLKT